jgi:septum formation protein
MSKLILASASPRRQHLLEQLGLPFTVVAADIDERPRPTEAPRAYVKRMASAKAQQIALRHPEAFVLGADTLVTIDAAILGKPRDTAHARAMLQQLSGRVHSVMTGVALLQHSTQRTLYDIVSTRVHFRVLTPDDIDTYLATDEPFDKAGAYAIQGAGGAFVICVEGCYTNVVGLPLQRTAALLREVGFTVPDST